MPRKEKWWLGMLILGTLTTHADLMDDPIEASNPGALKEEILELREALPDKTMSKIEAAIQGERYELLNDPFLAPDDIETALAERLEGTRPVELLAQEATTIGDEGYWEMREAAYLERLQQLQRKQTKAHESKELLEQVYIYNVKFEWEGQLTIDKAKVRFQLRNGTDTPLEAASLRLNILLPEGAQEHVIKKTRYSRLKDSIKPWETKTVTINIKNLLPDDILLGPISHRNKIRVDARLHNFKPVSREWAVTYFTNHNMRSLKTARQNLYYAKLAQGKATAGSVSARMMME